jgi:hypothetical protein
MYWCLPRNDIVLDKNLELHSLDNMAEEAMLELVNRARHMLCTETHLSMTRYRIDISLVFFHQGSLHFRCNNNQKDQSVVRDLQCK